LNSPLVGELFHRHHRALLRYAYRVTRRHDVAEDLVQETFARAVRSVETYEPRGRDLAWLFSILRRLLLDRHRAESRSSHVVRDADGAASAAGHQELSAILQQALDQLNTLEREAFLLREIGGLTYNEIAQVSETTIESVRSRIYRARLQLRSLLCSDDR
jgi:RNA polymerase sigma-70 factor (ECF subfamily)